MEGPGNLCETRPGRFRYAFNFLPRRMTRGGTRERVSRYGSGPGWGLVVKFAVPSPPDEVGGQVRPGGRTPPGSGPGRAVQEAVGLPADEVEGGGEVLDLLPQADHLREGAVELALEAHDLRVQLVGARVEDQPVPEPLRAALREGRGGGRRTQIGDVEPHLLGFHGPSGAARPEGDSPLDIGGTGGKQATVRREEKRVVRHLFSSPTFRRRRGWYDTSGPDSIGAEHSTL